MTANAATATEASTPPRRSTICWTNASNILGTRPSWLRTSRRFPFPPTPATLRRETVCASSTTRASSITPSLRAWMRNRGSQYAPDRSTRRSTPSIPGHRLDGGGVARMGLWGRLRKFLGASVANAHQSHVISADACPLLDEQRKTYARVEVFRVGPEADAVRFENYGIKCQSQSQSAPRI